ncbi:histidine--tRNA ligase [Oceanibacterium hippocampi]|uniref:Histidine--tRNA ligase n=1 Tax=Oceanibacterium hippocampi TaxID=745714 RepID=A0A1Y5R746_9PROT|nr:histidine--tRNA ligase [Oceanibacterium hippocampi]SLN09947.1 Histidine--tRNA ligase [Oceanibacterium hippocampi]
MPAPQPVRGTHDLLPDDHRRHRHVVDTARAIAERYGHEEVATPIFEFTEIFARSMGETSDVVSKEMYSFEDRGGEGLTLRPEYTAGICRAFISNGLMQNVPFRVFAHGPMFRYERPQKGRQRQFHQIDVEIIGAAEPQADIEVVALGWDILRALDVADKCVLQLNTLGDRESRTAYRAALVTYFSARKGELSEDSLARLERNPLRILDSKDRGDRVVVEEAPRFADYLNDHSRDFFAEVRRGLDALGIPFAHNERLVRGLDYYTHTAFEFVTDALGAQGAVIAGGRYDGLIETLGGPSTPGIGWAGGIERLAMLADGAPSRRRPVALIPIGEAAEAETLRLAHALRDGGEVVELAFKGNLGRRMKRANKVNARAAVIVGDDELAAGAATLRDLDSGEQRQVPLGELAAALRASA